MRLTEDVDAWYLRLPLVTPYRLAFGPVTHYDTLLVRRALADGRTGFGEATLLTGYTDETIVASWSLATTLIELAAGSGPPLDTRVAQVLPTNPFLATAFATALEMALGSPWLVLAEPTVVPVLGLLQAAHPAQMADAVEALLAQGLRTLKVKVGMDVETDAAFVRAAQAAVAGRARLRLDANQGYDEAAALAFVDAIAPDDIELFEQPCAAGDWASHLAVARHAARRGIATMLDESIFSLAEIEEAARLGAARFVKVKLMKFGSLERLAAAIERIRALGMTPVLGNGVATEVSCWQEACVAARLIDNAGEMNGFLKPHARLFAEPLPFADGAIRLPAGYRPEIDLASVRGLALAHASARGLSLSQT